MLTNDFNYINENGIAVNDKILSPDLFNDLQIFFEKNVSWTFGSQSDRKEQQFSHWNHDFINALPSSQTNYEQVLYKQENVEVLVKIWLRLKETILKGHELVRLYANGHTYGVEGYPHIDNRSMNNYSTVLYLNPAWCLEWAGETIIANELQDVTHAVLPKPGRMITFNGRLWHSSRSVSRRCPALRVCLVIKTRVACSDEKQHFHEHLEFLSRHGTERQVHSGRSTLQDHLVGTATILRKTGANEIIQLAGLYHSIYSTRSFQHVTIPHEDKAKVVEMIGDKAERLVRAFSILPRPRLLNQSLIDNTDNWQEAIWDSLKEYPMLQDLRQEDLYGLMHLEFANLVEQKGLHLYPEIGKYAIEQGWLNKDGYMND